VIGLVGLYRPWWVVLDAARMIIRALVEAWRSSWLWPLGMASRFVLHVLITSPWIALWLLVLSVTSITQWTVVGGLVVWAVCELVAAVPFRHPFLVGFATFRRGVALRRRWPRTWGDHAGRTRRVQAETGKEPSTPVRWRPLVDHPRISWLFLPTSPGSVEFLVGPPPDRTFADLANACPALAARIPFVESLEIEFDSDRSSFGVLRATFTGATPTTPAFTTTTTGSDPDDLFGGEDDSWL
jgi:hypothetical protein